MWFVLANGMWTDSTSYQKLLELLQVSVSHCLLLPLSLQQYVVVGPGLIPGWSWNKKTHGAKPSTVNLNGSQPNPANPSHAEVTLSIHVTWVKLNGIVIFWDFRIISCWRKAAWYTPIKQMIQKDLRDQYLVYMDHWKS